MLGGLVPRFPVYACRQSGHVQLAPLVRCSIDAGGYLGDVATLCDTVGSGSGASLSYVGVLPT